MTSSRKRRRTLFTVTGAPLLAALLGPSVMPSTGETVQARLAEHLTRGRPIVVHVVVALCDNANQGIVRVPEQLGNGQRPKSNLYWGAMYGVRTHLTRRGGWSSLESPTPSDERILDRVVLFQTLDRNGTDVSVFIVADAWDGAHIRSALRIFLEIAAGRRAETVRVEPGSRRVELAAGGAAHLVAYVGHNGLMDFSLPSPDRREGSTAANSSIVLACASKPYFLDHLRAAGSHPLLLTTGLMAPEAYTLDAAIKSWVEESPGSGVRDAAARAYDRYQKCGLQAARGLFWSAP